MVKSIKNISKLCICFLAIVLFITGCGCDNKEEDNQENKTVESKVTTLDDQAIEGLKISGFSITYNDGISKIVANVENTTDQTISLLNIGMSLYDKDNNLLIETAGYFGNPNGIMMMAMFVVAAGFNRTQFVKNVASGVNRIAKGSLMRVMFGYVLIAMILSQFIQSSIIVFGIMAPMLISTCEEISSYTLLILGKASIFLSNLLRNSISIFLILLSTIIIFTTKKFLSIYYYTSKIYSMQLYINDIKTLLTNI